ncbi:DNA polymerase alpha accessory factor Mcl1 [Tieghemiomyces parasiticus]|uniref:DNA polymerase alpha accessory factor Mcl1 n=1 Tax=Tieghemiomyces parasiticus TaxID=78921 RepID=A0A9W7ZUI9_9FUNG|nr:DNA polymerase alpha accessory factor Mcl1 [Tieghemiomyces parasiticus]
MPDHLADLQPRFAHIEGQCPVQFSADGSHIITGGADCLVRVFQTAPDLRDLDSRTLESQTDSITGLAVANTFLAVGSEDHSVVLYDYPSLDYRALIARSALPVRDVGLSHDGKWVGLVTDDQLVRLVQTDNATQTLTLKGHDTSLRSLSFHPTRDLLATLDSEGTVRVWNYADDVRPLVKYLPQIAARSDPDSAHTTAVRWHPKGTWLAVPTPQHNVTLYDPDTWQPAFQLVGRHKAPVAQCAWSPHGTYLATADTQGGFVLWHVRKQTSVFHDQYAVPLSHAAWSPTANILALTDSLGMLTIWDEVIPVESGLPLPHQPDTTATLAKVSAAMPVDEFAPQPTARLPANISVQLDRLFESDTDSMRPNEDPMALDGSSDLDSFIVDDGDDERVVAPRPSHRYVDDDDPGHRQAPRASRQARADVTHPRFQPGTTPYLGKRRFLAFSMIGHVASIDHETHCTVNVEFHDKALHRDFHFTDHYRFTLASLGERGILFGTEATPDEPSLVSYRPFESWAAKSDWLYKLPVGESAAVLCIAAAYSAVVTTQGYLRVFSSSGLQSAVCAVPTSPVCLAGGGPYFLMIHQAVTGDGLGYLLYDAERRAQVQCGTLPLPTNVGIQWAGFSDTQVPAVYDTRGTLFVLDRYRVPGQAQWAPVWDGRVPAPKIPGDQESDVEETEDSKPDHLEPAASDDWLWVVGFTGTQVSGVLCKRNDAHHGRSRSKGPRYTLTRPPPVPMVPRPLVTQVDLKVPLLLGDRTATQIEERLVRSAIFTANQQEDPLAPPPRTPADFSASKPSVLREYLQEDKLALQLIQSACKADRIHRALDLVTLLHLPKSVDAAIKIAMFHRYPALAERMNLIKEAKFTDDEDEADDDEEVGSVHSVTSGRPAHRVTPTHLSAAASPTLPSSPLGRPSIPAPTSVRPAPVNVSRTSTPGGMAVAPAAVTRRLPLPLPAAANPFAVAVPNARSGADPSDTDHIPRGNSFFNAVDDLMQADVVADKAGPGKDSRKRPAQSTLAAFSAGAKKPRDTAHTPSAEERLTDALEVSDGE